MVPWVFTAICISPLRKSTSLYFCTWNILFFFPWNLSCIFSFAVMWFGLFFLNEMRRKRIFSTHVWRERKRKTSRLLYRYISLVFSTRGTLFLRPYYLSVLSLSFDLRSDNVNWNSCIHTKDFSGDTLQRHTQCMLVLFKGGVAATLAYNILFMFNPRTLPKRGVQHFPLDLTQRTKRVRVDSILAQTKENKAGSA